MKRCKSHSRCQRTNPRVGLSLLDARGSQWKPFMAEGSRSRTYQEASDAPSWV